MRDIQAITQALDWLGCTDPNLDAEPFEARAKTALENMKALIDKLGGALYDITDIDCDEWEPIVENARAAFVAWTKENSENAD